MNILWLHSGGVNNTNTTLDLGGSYSQFPIALNPLNNLFIDVTPEETVNGFTEYRCFYIYNNNTSINLLAPNINISNQGSNGSYITIGAIRQNEVQRITINGNPDINGYIILQTEFGPAFTANVDGNFTNFASNIQSALQNLPFCSTCTAVLTTPPLPASPYIDITYNGEAGKRKTQLIELIVNRLTSISGGSFLPSSYTKSSTYNTTGTSIIQISSQVPIDTTSYASAGPIYAFNQTTGLYVKLQYSSIDNITNQFTLTAPLTFELGDFIPDTSSYICYNEVFVPIISKSANVSIKKIVEGAPINTTANFIANAETTPPGVSFGSSIVLDGSILGQEGIPIWVQRQTTAGAVAAQNDFFNLSLRGTLIST